MRLTSSIVPGILGVLLLSVLLAACGGDDKAQDGTPASGSPGASVTSGAGARSVSGLSTKAQVRAADRVVTAPDLPTSPFEPSRGEAVLYDKLTGATSRLEAGQLGSFSPDARYYAWAKGEVGPQGGDGALYVLDLRSDQLLFIAQGRAPFFIDAIHVAFAQPSNPSVAVVANVENGQRTTMPYTEAKARYDAWRDALATTTLDGFRVTRTTPGGAYTVIDPKSGTALVSFDAFYAAPAGTGSIVVAAQPEGGVSNLFLVPIATGQAQFVGSAKVDKSILPLVANDRFVAWVDGFCVAPQGGALFILDRASGKLTQVNAKSGRWGYVQMTPEGQLAIGDFGATAFLDPATLQYTTVLPEPGDVAWSPDHRMAARGWSATHAGLCG